MHSAIAMQKAAHRKKVHMTARSSMTSHGTLRKTRQAATVRTPRNRNVHKSLASKCQGAWKLGPVPVVGRAGFEPATCRLGGGRSVQLS